MEAMTDSPTPPPGQATSAIARAIRSICSDGNANPHRVAVGIGGALAHAGFEICTHAEITRLRAEVGALREALREIAYRCDQSLVAGCDRGGQWAADRASAALARAALRGREDVR